MLATFPMDVERPTMQESTKGAVDSAWFDTWLKERAEIETPLMRVIDIVPPMTVPDEMFDTCMRHGP